MTDSTDTMFTETAFTGDLVINGNNVPVAFQVSAGADCRLIFSPISISPESYSLVAKTLGRPGATIEEFSLAGTSENGKAIRSDRVSVDCHTSGSDSHRVTISARAATLTLPLEKPVPTPRMRLWFRAFRAFKNPVIDTKLGKLLVEGEMENVGTDDMSGNVALQADTDNPGTNWREKADAFLRHMHRGLAFAQGGRLQTPRLDYISGSVWEATFYDGKGFTPELSVQHPLNQEPYIKALVARYEADGPLPDILWTAVGWMQANTTFDELRFITAITALETIVEHLLPDQLSTVIPKPDYRIFREILKEVVHNEKTMSTDAREIFCGRIDQNNTRSLSQKVDALFDRYTLPRRDFEGDVIRDLINLRNAIVHRGLIPNNDNIWPQIILVRELIARILLREIGFVGQYECYIGGYETREFPAPTVIAEPSAL